MFWYASYFANTYLYLFTLQIAITNSINLLAQPNPFLGTTVKEILSTNIFAAFYLKVTKFFRSLYYTLLYLQSLKVETLKDNKPFFCGTGDESWSKSVPSCISSLLRFLVSGPVSCFSFRLTVCCRYCLRSCWIIGDLRIMSDIFGEYISNACLLVRMLVY